MSRVPQSSYKCARCEGAFYALTPRVCVWVDTWSHRPRADHLAGNFIVRCPHCLTVVWADACEDLHQEPSPERHLALPRGQSPDDWEFWREFDRLEELVVGDPERAADEDKLHLAQLAKLWLDSYNERFAMPRPKDEPPPTVPARDAATEVRRQRTLRVRLLLPDATQVEERALMCAEWLRELCDFGSAARALPPEFEDAQIGHWADQIGAAIDCRIGSPLRLEERAGLPRRMSDARRRHLSLIDEQKRAERQAREEQQSRLQREQEPKAFFSAFVTAYENDVTLGWRGAEKHLPLYLKAPLKTYIHDCAWDPELVPLLLAAALPPAVTDLAQGSGSTQHWRRRARVKHGHVVKFLERAFASTTPEHWRFNPPSGAEPPLFIARDWHVGDVVDDVYQVLEVLDHGPTAIVHRVHQLRWKLDFAVKTLRAAALADSHSEAAFTAECEAWLSLGLHPHIVSCYYIQTVEGLPRAFAEYVDGERLSSWISDRRFDEAGGKRRLKQILDIAIQIAWALQHAHDHGVCHGRLSPAHVFVTNTGLAKVVGFQFSSNKAEEPGCATAPQLQIGGSCGMLELSAYLPDRSYKDVRALKCDVYLWAVTVLEMLTGDATQSPRDTLRDHLHAGTTSESLARLPHALVDLLDHCLGEPNEKTPHEIARELQDMYANCFETAYCRPTPNAARLGYAEQPGSLLQRARSAAPRASSLGKCALTGSTSR